MTPYKTDKERMLFIKWHPIFMNNQTFTEQQINEYKQDISKL